MIEEHAAAAEFDGDGRVVLICPYYKRVRSLVVRYKSISRNVCYVCYTLLNVCGTIKWNSCMLRMTTLSSDMNCRRVGVGRGEVYEKVMRR